MHDHSLLVDAVDEADLWRHIELEFFHAGEDLFARDVETREEALREDRPKEYNEDIRDLGVSTGYDSREHFREIGRKTWERLEPLVEARNLSFEFFQQWGILTFCHGFIVAHISNDADALSDLRKGKASGETREARAHKKWFALLSLQGLGAGLTRREVEREIFKSVKELSRTGLGSFQGDWFKIIVDDDDNWLAD